MTQNVPFIVAQHLNTVKHNTSAIRGLAQLSCGSKLSKQRQAIPAICESDVRGLAWAIPAQAQSEKVRRIRLRFDSGYSERHRRNNLRQLVVRSTKIYSWDYFTWYANHGFPQKQDFTAGHIHTGLSGSWSACGRPCSSWSHIATCGLWCPKRSRTRGSIDPVASNIVIDYYMIMQQNSAAHDTISWF